MFIYNFSSYTGIFKLLFWLLLDLRSLMKIMNITDANADLWYSPNSLSPCSVYLWWSHFFFLNRQFFMYFRIFSMNSTCSSFHTSVCYDPLWNAFRYPSIYSCLTDAGSEHFSRRKRRFATHDQTFNFSTSCHFPSIFRHLLIRAMLIYFFRSLRIGLTLRI